jgi:hypothetical protein
MQLVLCFLSLGLAAQTTVNPVEKVLTLLEDLRKKVLLDGEVEQKQMEKFSEWCKDGAVSKQYEIKTASAKVEDYKAVIEKEKATIMDAESSIADLVKAVTRNQQDLDAATEIRDKEHTDFSATDAEMGETIDMLGRAIGIIAKSVKGGSFAQISKASVNELVSTLTVVAKASVVSTDDAATLTSLIQDAEEGGDDFLSASAPDAAAYETHSTSILDVLEDMKEKALAMKNEAEKGEMKAQHSFEMLAASLKNEIAADEKELNAAKSTKSTAEEIKATAEADLLMTEKMLAEAKDYLAKLSQDCQTKAADWEFSQKERAEELQALTDALAIIKEKTGAGSSRAYGFIEENSNTRSRSRVVPDQVLNKLRTLGKKDVVMSALMLQVQTAFEMNTGDVFGKVKGMIQEMIDKLVAEAAEEASHKAWCDKETSETQEKIDDHTRAVDKLSTKIDKASAAIAQLTESVALTATQLADLAKTQAAMDEMRAEEKAEFEKASKDFKDGVEGLTMALELLREYYAATPESLLQQPTTSVHSKSGDAATGILGLLEVAQSDFSKLLSDITVEEEAAVKEYEKVTHENNVSKAMKEADVKYQTKEKAGLEKSVADLKDDRASEQAELDAVLEYFARVKPGCTVKPMTYEERKARRESEIAGLKEALTILAAEEPAFLAIRTVRRTA